MIDLIGDEIAWLKNLREEGRKNFVMPTPKDEKWRYTKLRDFKPEEYVLKTASMSLESPKIDLDAYQIHFINGYFNPQKSNLPDDTEVMPLVEALITDPECPCKSKDSFKINPKIDLKENPFAALNTAYLQEGVYIRISQTLDKPIVLVNHTNTNEKIFYNIRNMIALEKGVSAEFMEVYSYEGIVKSDYFGNHVNEIVLDEGAKLNHYKLQDEAFYATHMAYTLVEQKKNSFYNYFCLQKGGQIARDETSIKLSEENASAKITGAYIMNGWATIDFTTDVEHLHPGTFSEQSIKGVVGGDARGIFQGKIHIAKHAAKSAGHLMHRAILLSDMAEVDAKPELEIFADDVKCSHGVTCGQLDKEQLFYMQSRGIELEEASRLLIEAYLFEVIEAIENEQIKEWMKAHV